MASGIAVLRVCRRRHLSQSLGRLSSSSAHLRLLFAPFSGNAVSAFLSFFRSLPAAITSG